MDVVYYTISWNNNNKECGQIILQLIKISFSDLLGNHKCPDGKQDLTDDFRGDVQQQVLFITSNMGKAKYKLLKEVGIY